MQKIFTAIILALLLVSCGNSGLRNQSGDTQDTHVHQEGDDHVHQEGDDHVHQNGDDHVHQNGDGHVHQDGDGHVHQDGDGHVHQHGDDQDCDDHVHHPTPPGQESFTLTEDESIVPDESTSEHDH